MKIAFEDKSYIEVSKSNNSDKIFITVAAKSIENARSLVVNSVELTQEQLLLLVQSLS